MARLRGLLLGLGPWLLTALLTALVLPAVAYAINVDRVDGAVSALLVGQDGKALASTGAGGLNIAPVAPLTLTSTTSPQLTVAYDGSHSLTVGVASNGSVTLTPTGTLTFAVAGTTITSAGSSALAVGPNGTTNPAFVVNAGTASQNNGIMIIGNSGGGGAAPTIRANGSSTDIDVVLASQGAGAVRLDTNSGTLQVYIPHTASAVNYLQLTGGTTGNPASISVGQSGGGLKVDANTTGVVSIGTVSTGGVTMGGPVSVSTGTFNIQTGGSTTISTGVGVIHMSTANPATNAAWIPIAYAGTTYYVPGYTTNAP